jgi:hypothetical protein
MAYGDVQPYKAKNVNAPLPEYDAMRARLTQRTNADTGQQQDAMARRFAAQGGLNSGAAIKQQQMIADQGVQNREQGMEGIQNQESAEQRRLNEIESGREFTSQEAATGRQFQAGESQLGRDFQGMESQRGRDFTAGQNKLTMDQNASQFGQTFGLQQKQYDTQTSQADRQYQMDKNNDALNQAQMLMPNATAADISQLADHLKAGGTYEQYYKKKGWLA